MRPTTRRNPAHGPSATQTALLATMRRTPFFGPLTSSGTPAVEPARKPYPISGPSITNHVPHAQAWGSGPAREEPRRLTVT